MEGPSSTTADTGGRQVQRQGHTTPSHWYRYRYRYRYRLGLYRQHRDRPPNARPGEKPSHLQRQRGGWKCCDWLVGVGRLGVVDIPGPKTGTGTVPAVLGKPTNRTKFFLCEACKIPSSSIDNCAIKINCKQSPHYLKCRHIYPCATLTSA